MATTSKPTPAQYANHRSFTLFASIAPMMGILLVITFVLTIVYCVMEIIDRTRR